ncbi:MAG TPA: bifunctional riboflavin kinase/FAD synthetase [Alphaproteobacteria bacterium]|nr:bifunctional riboflavin kinase/FAD synthetase [Alphaproteobacteria bacterium]
MEIFTATTGLPTSARGTVAALGNFDGLHKGHQAVLNAARALAKAEKRTFAVVTFEPHPRALFFPDHAPFRLTPTPIKRELLAEMGVDALFEIPFNAAFSKITAQEFMQRILLDEMDVAHAVAGHDFVFGHKRAGTMQALKDFFGGHERSVTEIAPQKNDGQLWSSTRIREQLQAGDMAGAREGLGRDWEIEGVVGKGDGAGHKLGYPTANLDLNGYLRPRFGVYAVRVRFEGKTLNGVANIGTRPTMNGRDERFEVHLFDFQGDLYGKTLRVALVDFIRPEKAFPSLEALKAAIAEDCLAAKARLA